MVDAILTPLDFSAPERVGRRRFWKQILPVRSIDYDGQKIDFNEEFHQDLALAFKQGAFDQVPLVFADGNNGHNMDPRNFGGDIIDLQNRGKTGTWALIEADRAAAKAIRRNPKLGVSARILQGVKKADGRTFKRAVNHVLLTMNPRVGGMQPWQAVDLSEDADIEVVDLTAETFQEGPGMRTKPKTKTADSRRQIDLSALNDDEFATLIDLATTAGVLDPEADEDELVDDETDLDDENGDETDPKEKVRKKKSRTKITVEEDSEDNGDDDGDDDEDPDDDSTDLSERQPKRRTRVNSDVQAMRIDLAEQRWSNDRDRYIADGVPPFLLDLAGPILSSPDVAVIDLADGSNANPAKVVREMLDGFKGLIDLTPDIGHMIDLSDAQNKDDEDAQFLKAWSEQYS